MDIKLKKIINWIVEMLGYFTVGAMVGLLGLIIKAALRHYWK